VVSEQPESPEQAQPAMRPGGTPIWVWVIYSLGILGAGIFVLSGLFVLGAYLATDDVPVTYDVSLIAILLWGGLMVLAAFTWLWRRGGGQ
jgi:hypothetical protein